ncbi:PASTA domain-containing protein, partial [Streptomyces sp. SYSU K217416]
DLYSVGIMLFQLLTGRLPFDADSPLAIAYAHVQEEPVAPSTVNRSVTPAMDALVARALKKNPNERFPTAAAMRDECARITSAGLTGAPVIVAGGPTQSGAGVGSAVFPPVDTSAQMPPSGVQTPYQPGPYTPGPSMPSPSMPSPSAGYGYPQQGYATPAPVPGPGQYAQQGASTPPPYTISPAAQGGSAGGGGGSKRNMPVIVGAIAVAVLAVGGLITAIALDKDAKDEPGPNPGASASQSQKPGFKGPDHTKTIDKEECTEPDEAYDDPDKVRAPDFRLKHIASVKECLQAAGWSYNERDRDEAVYGEGAVMEQFPAPNTDIDPKDVEFTFDVSTGNPE